MPARMTIERLLRDNDDASGQTIRKWNVEINPNSIMVRMNHGDGFILMSAADVDQFVADLQWAKVLAISLSEEMGGT